MPRSSSEYPWNRSVSGGDRGVVAEEGDPAVSVRDEVRHRCSRAGNVVDDHGVVVGVRWLAVDVDHMHPDAPFLFEEVVPAAYRHDDEPVHTAGREREQKVTFAVEVLVGAPGEQQVTAFAASVLDRPVQR